MITSHMFEGYCADIEVSLREANLRVALRLSLALPDISVALEDAQLASTKERYLAWCKQWLQWDALKKAKPNAIERLHSLYLRSVSTRAKRPSHREATAASLRLLRMRRRARVERALGRSRVWHPVNRVQRFRVELIEALIAGARRWYQASGKHAGVQRNLARIALSG